MTVLQVFSLSVVGTLAIALVWFLGKPLPSTTTKDHQRYVTARLLILAFCLVFIGFSALSSRSIVTACALSSMALGPTLIGHIFELRRR